MSDKEDFLTRWSRRKSEAAESHAAPAQTSEGPAEPAGDQAPKDDAQPPFDPKSLPPVESIEAGTDITAFLRAGVPAELARAALRRAWAADPNIRDFIGLSENSWDFASGSIPGFGPLSPEDAGQLLARYSGRIAETVNETVNNVGQMLQSTESPEHRQAALDPERSSVRRAEVPAAEAAHIAAPHSVEQLQRNENNAATQKYDRAGSNDTRPTTRRHGGALPRE